MKKALFIIFLLIQTIHVMAQTEHQKYKVLLTNDNIEIRYYPASIMASIQVEGDYDSSKGKAFKSLASYIFRGNKQEKKIAMTAPVLMESKNDSSKMSFIMPSEYNLQTLPAPDNSEVEVKSRASYYTASIRFKGWASTEKNQKYTDILVNWLKSKKLAFNNEVIFKGYDSPFRLKNRRNEIHILLNKDAILKSQIALNNFSN